MTTAAATAVGRARLAQATWGERPVSERTELLGRLADLLRSESERLAGVVAAETGKPPADAVMAEIVPSVLHVEYLRRRAGAILQRRHASPGPLIGSRAWVDHRPLGVSAVITPANYPFFLPLLPTVTAVAAGNAVVVKPAPSTPRSGAAISELVADAGFPPDLVQVMPGGAEAGAALAGAGVDIISFTGSAATARLVAARAATTLTPLILELGGAAPMLVLADADLGRAARAAVWGGFFHAGQSCVAVERLYVADAVYRPFLDRLQVALRDVESGDDPARGIGAVMSPARAAAVEAHVRDAVGRGARVLRGRLAAGEGLQLAPTVVVDADHSMAVMRQETFGPLIAVMAVADVEEAVELANRPPAGLHASVWTGDRDLGRRLAARLRAGTVAINDVMVNYGIPDLPFGGVAESGYGRHGGPEGLLAFTSPQAVIERRWRLRREPHWFPRRGGAAARVRLLRLLRLPTGGRR